MGRPSDRSHRVEPAKQLVVVEVLKGFIGDAEERLGDWWTKGVVGIARPYVEITFGNLTQRTRVHRMAWGTREGCAVNFDNRLVFPVENPLSDGDGIAPVHIGVYDHRTVQALRRGDPLVGNASLPLGKSTRGQCKLELKRGDKEGNHGWLLVQYGIIRMDVMCQILSSTADHSLARVVRAIASSFYVSDKLQCLKKTKPLPLCKPAHCWSSPTDPEDDQSLREFLTSFSKAATQLQNNDVELSDCEAIKGFAPFSRQLLAYIADNAAPGYNPIDLALVWIKAFFLACVRSDLQRPDIASNWNDERLRQFLLAAKVEQEFLMPSDADGCEVQLPSGWSWFHQTRRIGKSTPGGSTRSRTGSNSSNSSNGGSWFRGWGTGGSGGVKTQAVAGKPGEVILGRGSHGCVWRARDRCTGLVFAVKDAELSGRVSQREADIASILMNDLVHPCIVTLYGVFENHEISTRSIVMEYCPEGDLEHFVKERREQEKVYTPPERALVWFAHIFLALEYLHLTPPGLLMRDVKPGNVVLTQGGKIAKLTDFGMSRKGAVSDGHYSFNPKVPPGSPHYIAPEVITGEGYDYSCDLYSFGVLVWVVLTGGLVSFKGSRIPPVPPCAEFKDIRGLLHNWRLLKECVTEPGPNDAIALPSKAAEDFVLRLTDRRPLPGSDGRKHVSKGMRHQDIRKHAFMNSVELPERGRNATLEWLARTDICALPSVKVQARIISETQ